MTKIKKRVGVIVGSHSESGWWVFTRIAIACYCVLVFFQACAKLHLERISRATSLRTGLVSQQARVSHSADVGGFSPNSQVAINSRGTRRGEVGGLRAISLSAADNRLNHRLAFGPSSAQTRCGRETREPSVRRHHRDSDRILVASYRAAIFSRARFASHRFARIATVLLTQASNVAGPGNGDRAQKMSGLFVRVNLIRVFLHLENLQVDPL
jgi:hypothetical protein